MSIDVIGWCATTWLAAAGRGPRLVDWSLHP